MQVKEFMHYPVVIDEDTSLSEAAKLMSAKGIGSLIVFKEGKIKGILTERDVLKNFGKNERVSEVMSKQVITLTPKASLSKALEIMREKKIKRLPIIAEGKLTGIITLTDIAAHIDEIEGDTLFDI